MGITEKLFHKMQEFGGANALACAEIRGAFSVERMRAAVGQLAARHALLRCRVDVKDQWPHFVLHDEPELPLVVVERGSSEVRDRVIGEERKVDYYQQPWLWRVTCVRDSADPGRFWMVVCMNHSVIDGTSLWHAIKQLLTDYATPSNTPARAAVKELEPNLESFQKYRLTFFDLLRFVAGQLVRLLFRRRRVPAEARVDSSQRTTQTVLRQFSPELSEQLRRRVREESTTVNGALSAAILFAAARRMAPGGSVTVDMETNVSFRKQYEVNNEQAGALVSILPTAHKVSPSRSFWDLARECREAIKTLVDNDRHVAATYLWEAIQRMMSDSAKRQVLDGKELGRLAPVAISNVGALDVPREYPGLTLEGLRFTAAQQGFGYYFGYYVGSLAGRLQITLSYAEPVISRATADAVADEVVTLLEHALVKGDFTHAQTPKLMRARASKQKPSLSPAQEPAGRHVA